MDNAQALLDRLDAAEARIRQHATREIEAGLTAPDTRTGERWDGGQLWAHIADILPYWGEQARILIESYEGEPVPFGRGMDDPTRLEPIEQHRHDVVQQHWSRLEEGADLVRSLIADADERAWTKVKGLHRLRGPMGLEEILTSFMLNHLEEHADQLDALAGSGSSVG